MPSAFRRLAPHRSGVIFAVALAASACCGVGPAVAQTDADRAPAELEVGVDARIPPGDDFFAFANGAWLQATRIPAGKERWGAFDEIGDRTRQRVATLLQDAAAQPAGSRARRLADFHAAYLNEAAIEAQGLAVLKPQFDRIARVRDKAGLTRLLGQQMPADVDPLNLGVYRSAQLLGLAVQPGIHAEKTDVAFLVQGGLGLWDRERYLGSEVRWQDLRGRYLQHIERMLSIAGFDRAAERAQAVMALETAIARTHATADASANDRNADTVWTRADFARQAPGLAWTRYFAAAGLGRQRTFAVWQPGAVTGAAALVASQPLRAWKDYLRFHALHDVADVLPRAVAEPTLALQVEAGLVPQPGTRAQRAVTATQAALSDALGQAYTERYFPARQKAQVQSIASNVIAAFGRRVEAVTWMSPDTKALALAKLKTLYFGIGHPDRWPDDDDPSVRTDDALGNLQRVAQRNHRRAVARLGRHTEPTVWCLPAQSPGAVLTFHRNAANFAAALLQAPKFDPAQSEAANYGAIGAIVGHEASHFIDTLGADYEADGTMRRWWTAQDLSGYQASTQALVDQYAAYRPFPDLGVNGNATLTENLADLGGLAAAFEAYRRAQGDRPGDPLAVRQRDRDFFIGFARAWRAKTSDDGLRAQLRADNHAPERYRIATVRNLDAWYEAFDVQPGQRLYLEPKARLRIW